MMFKREDGAVLVVESAMIIQLVMLMVVLFVMSAILILQKNQLYYNVNHALQMYVKTVDKPQTISVYANENSWEKQMSVENYLNLYNSPRPYRQLFYKNDNSVAFSKLTHDSIEKYTIGNTLNEQVNFAQTTRQLIRKIATVETSYSFNVWTAIQEDTVLSGKINLRAPILAINDFVRQVDFASEIVTGQFVPLQQFKKLSGLFSQLNDGLRHLGGIR